MCGLTWKKKGPPTISWQYSEAIVLISVNVKDFVTKTLYIWCSLQCTSCSLVNCLFFSADTDVFGKPPCYEEAVLMEDPPPPYSEVLADPRGGTYTKPSSRSSREHQESETSKMAPVTVFPECGYSSLIRLPSARRWDSLGHLLSTMDLNHNSLPVEPQASAIATMPREGRTHTDLGLRGLRGLDQHYGLPTAFPLLGRSTAVWGHKNRPPGHFLRWTLTMLNHLWSEDSARGISNSVFWGPHQFRMIQLCPGVHLQIHHTRFSLSSSSLLYVASPPDAEQQLLCECCCHGSWELSAAHQHRAPHIISSSFLICGSLI